VWAPHLGRQTLFFLKKISDLFSHHRLSAVSSADVTPIYFLLKNWPPFLVITVAFIHFRSFTRVSPIISGMLLCFKKFAAPLVVAPILWGPCSAEHAEHA